MHFKPPVIPLKLVDLSIKEGKANNSRKGSGKEIAKLMVGRNVHKKGSLRCDGNRNKQSL